MFYPCWGAPQGPCQTVSWLKNQGTCSKHLGSRARAVRRTARGPPFMARCGFKLPNSLINPNPFTLDRGSVYAPGARCALTPMKLHKNGRSPPIFFPALRFPGSWSSRKDANSETPLGFPPLFVPAHPAASARRAAP